MDKSLSLPKYALQGDAAFDLLASEPVTLKPSERVQVKTGLKMEIPDGYVGFIWDKSGLSHKAGLKTLGGVIDSGYRGEVMVGMINLSDAPYTFERGNKVAQMCIQKKEDVTIVEVEELSETARGEGGFGSTGK
jgi:dUTP pyrophosphatase